LVDELFRLFRHGNSLEEKKQKKMVKYLGRKEVEVIGEKKNNSLLICWKKIMKHFLERN
jgi:hypothetical protein